jgi:hypothetical protein
VSSDAAPCCAAGGADPSIIAVAGRSPPPFDGPAGVAPEGGGADDPPAGDAPGRDDAVSPADSVGAARPSVTAAVGDGGVATPVDGVEDAVRDGAPEGADAGADEGADEGADAGTADAAPDSAGEPGVFGTTCVRAAASSADGSPRLWLPVVGPAGEPDC